MLPVPTRKLGSLLRGKATPYQIFTACLLGSLIGFTAVHWWPIGLVFGLLLAIINANFLLAGIMAGIGSLLSLALLPIEFHIGTWLIPPDGPTARAGQVAVQCPGAGHCSGWIITPPGVPFHWACSLAQAPAWRWPCC